MNTTKIISNLFSSGNFDKNQYQSEDDLPYHKFNANDYEKLLNPSDDGQLFVFKNQNGEILKFKLTKSTLGKKTYKTLISHNFWQKQFCYDEQEIQLECMIPEFGLTKLTYNLKKFPSILYQSNADFRFGNHSKFVSTIQFPLWNDNNLIPINYQKPVSTMIINTVFYTTVRVLEVNNSQKIYFDEHKGIIGFDDANGEIWRLNL